MTANIQISAMHPDGRIFVVGGDDFGAAYTNLVEVFNGDERSAGQALEDMRTTLLNPTGLAPAVAAAAPLRGAPTSPAGTAPAPAAAPGAPTCAHGARTFRSGQGKKGPWSAWFCPLPSDRKSEQCEAIWG